MEDLTQQEQPKAHASSFSALLTVLGIVVFLVLLSGAYLLGTKQSNSNKTSINGTQPSPTPTDISVNTQANAEIYPAATTSAINITGGGLYTLKKYSLSVPNVWYITRTTQSFAGKIGSEALTLSRENYPDYTIEILQGGGDGGVCNYPDNKVTTGIVDGDYSTYTQIKDAGGDLLRRGQSVITSKKIVTYKVCQLKQGLYVNLTDFGWIAYGTPENPNQQLLKEMDAVLSSLKAQ